MVLRLANPNCNPLKTSLLTEIFASTEFREKHNDNKTTSRGSKWDHINAQNTSEHYIHAF